MIATFAEIEQKHNTQILEEKVELAFSRFNNTTGHRLSPNQDKNASLNILAERMSTTRGDIHELQERLAIMDFLVGYLCGDHQ